METGEIQISELELADEVLADMVLPVDTATETRAVTLKQLRAWLGSSLPTGFILPAVGKINDERFTLLDGKTLSREGAYEAFCNKVVEEVQAGNWFACSEEDYAQDLSECGQCGKFVVSNDYVRIPTITRFIGATVTLSEIGKTYKESLPNIKGQLGNLGNRGGAIANGAFQWDYGHGDVDYSNVTGFVASFNASRSSSAYQDGAKVQPDHTKYPYYMVVSTGGTAEEVQIDVNKIYEDLNIKMNKDFSNSENVVKSFREQSIGWGFPDYASAVTRSQNTTYTAETNLWLYCEAYSGSDSAGQASAVDIKIDGVTITSMSGFHWVRTCFVMPIPKGSTFVCSKSGGGSAVFKTFNCKGE